MENQQPGSHCHHADNANHQGQLSPAPEIGTKRVGNPEIDAGLRGHCAPPWESCPRASGGTSFTVPFSLNCKVRM